MPKGLRRGLAASLALAGALVLATAPAGAQSMVCCNTVIQVGGNWTGTSRGCDCQQYFDTAPMPSLRRMCAQRAALACINTTRCSSLPAAPGDGEAPSGPEQSGLDQGFGASPPAPSPGPGGARPGTAPPTEVPPGAAPRMPSRLVYLVPAPREGRYRVAQFTAWLDANACAIAIAADNRPAAPASYIVRGRLLHGGGRVRIEAEADDISGGGKSAPVTAQAQGENAGAIARAARTALRRLKLVCRR